MIRLLAVVALLGWLGSGCSSGPSEDLATHAFFARVEFLFDHYNRALADQDALQLEGVTSELRRLSAAQEELLLATLVSPDPTLRAESAFALGFSRSRSAIGRLAGAAGDPEPAVRCNAIASLGMLGLAEVPLEPFHRALADPSREVRTAALFGLRPLVDETHDRGLLPQILERIGDPDTEVRNEALILLRKLKRVESVPIILKKCVKDPDPLIRSSAAETLGSIGPPALEANPYLIELLRDEESRVVGSAWKALNRINEKDFDRSYATWRDWYEDEQRHFYTCLDHREVNLNLPGTCPVCGKKLERLPKEGGRKPEPPPLVYGCPDHPAVMTLVPGKCGRCGKELIIRRPEAVSYYCPDHPEVVTTGPSKCGHIGCGKELVLRKPEVTAYACPDHPEVVTLAPGLCGRPGCGKILLPVTRK
jgi:hypothetical protein